MEKINKKFITSIFIFFIILLLSISIIMANNMFDENYVTLDKQKIYYEIKYFDEEFTTMIKIIVNDNEKKVVNWEKLEFITKILHNYWNSIILDLNYLEVNKVELTEF